MSDGGPDFAIHSWGDVMAVLSVTGALIGGIIWGLKLENRIDLLRERMHNMELSRPPKKRLLEDEE
jgi:hypothetical protein